MLFLVSFYFRHKKHSFPYTDLFRVFNYCKKCNFLEQSSSSFDINAILNYQSYTRKCNVQIETNEFVECRPRCWCATSNAIMWRQGRKSRMIAASDGTARVRKGARDCVSLHPYVAIRAYLYIYLIASSFSTESRHSVTRLPVFMAYHGTSSSPLPRVLLSLEHAVGLGTIIWYILARNFLADNIGSSDRVDDSGSVGMIGEPWFLWLLNADEKSFNFQSRDSFGRVDYHLSCWPGSRD